MPRAIGSCCRSLWIAAREATSRAANGGLRSAAATCAVARCGAESQSSSGIDVGRSSAPRCGCERGLVGDDEAVTRVLGGREARLPWRRGARARPDRRTRASSAPSGPTLAATSGLATTGSRTVVERLLVAEAWPARRCRPHSARSAAAGAVLTFTPPWPPQAVSERSATGPAGVTAASGPRASAPVNPFAALRPSAPPCAAERCSLLGSCSWIAVTRPPRSGRGTRDAQHLIDALARHGGGRSCAASPSAVRTTSTSCTALPVLRTGSVELRRAARDRQAGERDRRARSQQPRELARRLLGEKSLRQPCSCGRAFAGTPRTVGVSGDPRVPAASATWRRTGQAATPGAERAIVARATPTSRGATSAAPSLSV